VRTVLFYTSFHKFTGAYLKVWDYFNHVLSSPGHSALVSLAEPIVWDETNPWGQARDRIVPGDRQVEADIAFHSGMSWLQVEPDERDHPSVPVINLIQHVRHADPDNPRYRFLSHRAIRICVAPEVAEAIAATGLTRGPIVTIPDAIDFELVASASRAQRDIDILVVAVKEPELGARMSERLARRGRRIELVQRLLPRSEFIDRLGRSKVTLFLPNRKEGEGFYLPALEGMAAGTVVVCPDCIANRSFCLPGVNCFRPDYDDEQLLEATEAALAEHDALGSMRESALSTAREHDLPREREAFLDVLGRVDELWAQS
jgi:glycosyltransferase involved in cell wall biosynthesis